ncbi:SDR family oxidoreductase [Sphingobacterium sp. N143]|uniref:SDR family NAD(P)-dependent oxidoreductase n=1 Tax=Sphingobacterium sp. N143 TaxID=2746727 RepID=UPI002578AE1A|nr:glucose 1-dehydrogenase [Sphingobacterium sp. N143]MDM1293944.1 SDR family oxidoreductase [Sphingobacterium sp. N143]
MQDINNKVVVVTGAGNGIGKGIAELMAKRGAKVILATKYDDEGGSLENNLKEIGYWARYIQTDVSNEESVKNMVEQVLRITGKIDVLVNNAGITIFKSILEATLSDWNKVIDTDLKGVFLCSKYVAAAMIKNFDGGSIVNISSNHAYRTLPDTELYAAAKGGVNAMTRSMAISLGKFGIRVNAVCPGFTDTDHYQRWLSEKENPTATEKEIFDLHALGKISTPEDIAELVFFLVTDSSKNITGSDFLIDGGLTARLYHSDKF